MITDDSSKKVFFKVIFDILVVLSLISVFSGVLGFFHLSIPYLGFIGAPLVFGIAFGLTLIQFQWRLKKFRWFALNAVFVFGIFFTLFGFSNYLSNLPPEEVISLVKSGNFGNPVNSLFNLGSILVYLGITFLSIFYFLIYRRYLSGKLSLSEIGGEDFSTEAEIKKRYAVLENRYSTFASWLVWILLAGIILALVYLFLK
jgi:hypothetical protein